MSCVAGALAAVITALANMAMWAGMFGGNRDNANPFALASGCAAGLRRGSRDTDGRVTIAEYQADGQVPSWPRDPLALASHARISGVQAAPLRRTAAGQPGALMITNPFGRVSGSDRCFDSPPIVDRIRRLEAMARG